MDVLLNKKTDSKYVIVKIKEELVHYDFSNIELCVLLIDFKDLKTCKKFIENHKSTDFWIAADNISRDNVLLANKCGIKNIIPKNFNNKIIEEHFNLKRANFQKPATHYYQPLREMKVMIVDDNVMNIELLKEVLEDLSLQVKSFSKPQEALESINSEHFDMFLLDIMMPEISGYDLALKIKNSINQKAKIIFVSALSDSENKIAVYNLDSCAYIEKPFDIEVVRAQIYSILRTKQLKDAISTARETFLAMSTHDLKTPVNAEIRALELLLQNQFGDLSESQTEIMSELLNSAKHMKNITENMLYTYKINSNNFEINKSSNNFNTLIKECLAEVKYLFMEQNQTIFYENAGEDLVLKFDRHEIKRAILNLCANAAENAPKTSEIFITLSTSNDSATFTIINKGKITLKNINDIFKKNISIAKKEKRLGSGLGLYIVKSIVEAHNGSVFADNMSDEHVKIGFSLPFKKKLQL